MPKPATCPLGHSCDSCMWLVRLRGTSPQSGQEIDQENCAIAWLPLLLVENSQQQRQTAAAVESFRNEMVEGNNVLAQDLLRVAADPHRALGVT